MDLSKILSITGKTGLYKLISQTKNSFIVESFIDGSRFPVFSHDGVATLDNISIFTDDEDVSLSEVLMAIYKKENHQKITASFNNNELKNFFAEVLPNFDRQRVYVSNIKKVIAWYNILVEYNIINEEDTKESTENTEATEEVKDAQETK